MVSSVFLQEAAPLCQPEGSLFQRNLNKTGSEEVEVVSVDNSLQNLGFAREERDGALTG